MKIVDFYKIAKLNKIDSPEQYQQKLLVLAIPEKAAPSAESNYRVLLKKYELETLEIQGKKFLLVDKSSSDISAIEFDLQTIEDVEVLDDNDYLSLVKSTKKANEGKSLGTCSFCGKKLTTSSSAVKSMGPVCEHKAMQLEMGSKSLDSYSNFKPLGSMSLKKGDSVVLKTKEGIGFYEFVTQKENSLILIDRKKLFVDAQVSPTKAVAANVLSMPITSIEGVCRPDKESLKGVGPIEQWWNELSEEE